jgi:hypothetical protein
MRSHGTVLGDANKLAQSIRVLLTVREFDTTVDVNPVGFHLLDRLNDVFRPKAACQNDRFADGGDDPSTDRPVVHRSSTANAIADVGVEQERIHMRFEAACDVDRLLVGHAYRLDKGDVRKRTADNIYLLSRLQNYRRVCRNFLPGLQLESAEFSATLLRLVTCAHSRRARVR